MVDGRRWKIDERRRTVIESERVKEREREREEEEDLDLCSFYSEKGYLLFRDVSRLSLTTSSICH